MFKIDSAKKAKQSARALEKALAPLGLDLQRGQALEVLAKIAGFADWNALSASLQPKCNQEAQAFSIFDVPLHDLSAVSVNGQLLDIQSVNLELWGWADDWDNPDNQYFDDSCTVLELVHVDDGLVFDESFSLAQLKELQWNSDLQCFVTKQGDEVKFLFYVPFGGEIKAPQVRKLEVPAGYRVYQTLMGTWRWSKGELGSPDCVDGENLPSYEEAVQDAVAHATNSEAERQRPLREGLRDLAEQIKSEYLDQSAADRLMSLDADSKQAHLDKVVYRLMTECAGLFDGSEAARRFMLGDIDGPREGS